MGKKNKRNNVLFIDIVTQSLWEQGMCVSITE